MQQRKITAYLWNAAVRGRHAVRTHHPSLTPLLVEALASLMLPEREDNVDDDILTTLLRQGPSTRQPETTQEMHKLKTAAIVYDIWTQQGKDVSGLAAR